MSLYRPKGSSIWVMDFVFRGQRIRESTGVSSITRARKICDKRRRDLEEGAAGIRRKKQPALLSVAAAQFRESNRVRWSAAMNEIAQRNLGHLLPILGKTLLVDIDSGDVQRYQAARSAEGASNRTINMEVALLRQIMRKHGLWARIAPDVKMLPERGDVGRALTAAEESMMLLECGRSRSRILLPFVVLSLETGARYNTIRTLLWANVDLINGCLKFGKDKTASGTGRTIPLSSRAVETLKFWAQNFPDRLPSHYVFPFERYGTSGTTGVFGFTGVKVYSADPTRPVGDIKTAWQLAKRRTRRHCPECKSGTLVDQEKPAAGYRCVDCEFVTPELPAGLARLRLHDLRHSAVSRMIAARVPLPIIAKIVGWSASTLAKMAARYGHFSMDELRGAVETISAPAVSEIVAGYPQNPPQSRQSTKRSIN